MIFRVSSLALAWDLANANSAVKTIKMNLAVLASGAGTTLNKILEMQSIENTPVKIKLLITDNVKAGAIGVAEHFNIKYHCLAPKNFDNFTDWDSALAQLLVDEGIDYVLLLGFLKKIGPAVLRQFNNRIINSHPSLLPLYGGKGMYGRHVHEAVIRDRQKVTGVTLHFVNEQYDQGQIIKQVKVDVGSNDNADTIEGRVKKMEKDMWLDFIRKWPY